MYCLYLVLILFDFFDSGNNAKVVEAGQQSHCENTGLIAEYCPAEMSQVVENNEADDADDEVNGAGGQHQPHPRPHGSEMRLVDRVEVLQALDRQLYLDVAHPRVHHPQHDDEQRDDRLHDSVRQMHILVIFDVSQVQRFLRAIEPAYKTRNQNASLPKQCNTGKPRNPPDVQHSVTVPSQWLRRVHGTACRRLIRRS